MCSLLAATGAALHPVVVAAPTSRPAAPTGTPQSDGLMLLGVLSAMLVLVSLGFVRSHRGARLLLAGGLTAQAVYGFLHGAWPLALIATILAPRAVLWWWRDRPLPLSSAVRHGATQASEARLARLFGSASEEYRSGGGN